MLEKDGARCEAPANLGPIHESFKMPSFLSNIENRVRKLPKPASAGQALQPVFEAVSNAFFAIEDRRDGGFTQRGEVYVRVSNLSDTDRLRVEVHDNGIGLDQARYVAFRTIDTDFKRQKGGKGVGRLFCIVSQRGYDLPATHLPHVNPLRAAAFCGTVSGFMLCVFAYVRISFKKSSIPRL